MTEQDILDEIVAKSLMVQRGSQLFAVLAAGHWCGGIYACEDLQHCIRALELLEIQKEKEAKP